MGGVKKRLREYPEKERALWRTFDRTPFENGVAAEGVSGAEVTRLLDYSTYFRRHGLPIPASRRLVSLRGRFGVADKNRAMVSRIIRQAVQQGAIVPVDASAGPKTMKYIPFWAAPDPANGN